MLQVWAWVVLERRHRVYWRVTARWQGIDVTTEQLTAQLFMVALVMVATFNDLAACVCVVCVRRVLAASL
jgi:hypothetical protein